MATLVIKNTAHDGYRRAGFAFARGENRLKLDTITQDQITQLENDPHLFVAIEADEEAGELVVAETLAAEAISTTAAADAQTEILNGSDTLPASIEIGADQVQLGEIIRMAFEQSGLTADQWNALASTDRDQHLQAVIDAARESAAAKTAEAKAPEAKRTSRRGAAKAK